MRQSQIDILSGIKGYHLIEQQLQAPIAQNEMLSSTAAREKEQLADCTLQCQAIRGSASRKDKARDSIRP